MDSSDFVSISELADEGRDVEDDWNYALMNYLQKLQTGSRDDLNHYYGLYYPFTIEMSDGSFWTQEEDNISADLVEEFYEKLVDGRFKFTHNVLMGESSKEDFQIEYQENPVKREELKLTFNPTYIQMYQWADKVFERNNGLSLSMVEFFRLLNDEDWFSFSGKELQEQYDDGYLDEVDMDNLPEWTMMGLNENYGISFVRYIQHRGWNIKKEYGINLFKTTNDFKGELISLSKQIDELGDDMKEMQVKPPGNDPVFSHIFYNLMQEYYNAGEIYDVNPLRLFLEAIGETGFTNVVAEARVFNPEGLFLWQRRVGVFMKELWQDIRDGEASFMVFIREYFNDEDDEYPTYGNQSIALDIINYDSQKMILNDFRDKYVFLNNFIGFKHQSRPQTFINYSLRNAFGKV
jgi:hypothetical protein